MAAIQPGRYRHFKGGEYEVLTTARHSETGEELVIYRALDEQGTVWARPASMWNERVERDGVAIKRFVPLGGMELSLREERPPDYRTVENLTREAFWNVYKPGCDEHLALHLLRDHPDFLPALSIVAEKDGRIVGHIAYSRARIVTDKGEVRSAICFGPISVLPECHGQGIGSRLIWYTLAMAKLQGHRAVVILGEPEYYRRFGFRPASEWGIAMKNGVSIAQLMAIELAPGALAGLRGGRFRETEVFAVDERELEAFDRNFPPKVKERTATQIF